MENQELEMILNAGLEKVAYEEGLAEYEDSLTKVASVHGFDPSELHEALEKVAAEGEEEQGRLARAKQHIANNKGKYMAGAGALGAAGLGAALHKNYGLNELAGRGQVGQMARGQLRTDALSKMDGAVDAVRGAGQHIAANKGRYAAGAAGAAGLAGAGVAGKKMYDKKKAEKEKTAAAYGLDTETFDYLIEQGLDALGVE